MYNEYQGGHSVFQMKDIIFDLNIGLIGIYYLAADSSIIYSEVNDLFLKII